MQFGLSPTYSTFESKFTHYMTGRLHVVHAFVKFDQNHAVSGEFPENEIKS